MILLVTRPQPDAERQAELLRARGHDVLVEPLLSVEFLDAGRLPLKGVQALAATSRNGLRALARNEALAMAKKLPLFAVGAATAEMARALGFANIEQGAGTAADLAPLIARECDPGKGAVMHLAGERLAANLKGDLEARGFTVAQPVLYRTVPATTLGAEVREGLAAGRIDGVLLMSPLTARTWSALVQAAGLAREAAQASYFCLSQAVADGLSLPGAEQIHVAESPDENGLLALITRKTAH